MKKKQENKQEKTVTAHEKAFKAAERKTRLQLSQVTNNLTSGYSHYVLCRRSVILCLLSGC